MKEMKLGDEAYREKGFKKMVVWVKPNIWKKYIRAAKKSDQTLRQFMTNILTVNAPK